MKLTKLIFFTFFLFFCSLQIIGTQKIIDKPSEGKSLVYFLRYSSLGFLINFRLYDENQFLGKIPYGEYLVYECNPGEHIFWVAAENRSFIHANLAPNATYVINLDARSGAFSAAVKLLPLSPKNKKDQNKLYKEVKNAKKKIFKLEEVSSENKSKNIELGLSRYNELKKKNSPKIEYLTPDMNFENANKPSK